MSLNAENRVQVARDRALGKVTTPCVTLDNKTNGIKEVCPFLTIERGCTSEEGLVFLVSELPIPNGNNGWTTERKASVQCGRGEGEIRTSEMEMLISLEVGSPIEIRTPPPETQS